MSNLSTLRFPFLNMGQATTGASAARYGLHLLAGGDTLHPVESPVAGDWFTVVPSDDWSSSNAVIGDSGDVFEGTAGPLTCDIRQPITLFYIDVSYGWEVC